MSAELDALVEEQQRLQELLAQKVTQLDLLLLSSWHMMLHQHALVASKGQHSC
jgi:hypothetical protein